MIWKFRQFLNHLSNIASLQWLHSVNVEALKAIQIFFHVNVHKFSIISGYRTRAKMETDRITLVHAVEIFRTIYTAPWFQGETHIAICFVNCIYMMWVW